MTDIAEVRAWNRSVGAVITDDVTGRPIFEYAPEFLDSGLELSPLNLPLRPGPSSPRVPEDFMGLPGLLADSLPDRFGHGLIDAWAASRGLSPSAFGAIDRLCYIGTRGMGALEFEPAEGPSGSGDHSIDIEQMVEIASDVLNDRASFFTSLDLGEEQAVKDMLSIGTSAGGARAKAVIAFNESTREIRSGQVDAEEGFEHYLIKFDGVSDDSREDLGTSSFHGRVELAYHHMARAAGIEMSHCRLLEENGRAHFMTKRFDRVDGEKLHMQTLSAMAHHDFNLPFSYEEALRAARDIGVPMKEREELFLRAMFNVTFRNQDDHSKNISFILREGDWHLSPAYDLTFAFNPRGANTRRHQMAVNAKLDGMDRDDFRALAATAGLRRTLVGDSLERIETAREKWDVSTERAGLDASKSSIDKKHRIEASFRTL